MPVYIVCYDFDYLFEIAKQDAFEAYGDETRLEPDEKPVLNAKGHRYDLCFRLQPSGRTWPDARGGLTLAEARAAAEALLPSPVSWLEP